MFVDTTRVPIRAPECPDDIIYIKPKMDFGTKQRVLDAMAKISATERGAAQIGVTMGAYTVALACHNIIGWEGPAFAGVDCTPDAIQRLDPDNPLVTHVLEEIARRNPLGKARPKSGSSMSAGGPSSTASAATLPETGISTSG